jgi:hypothetical protein
MSTLTEINAEYDIIIAGGALPTSQPFPLLTERTIDRRHYWLRRC